MRRLTLLFALTLLVFCGATAAKPAGDTGGPAVAPAAPTAVSVAVHRAASGDNWVVGTWTLTDDGKGPVDSILTSVDYHTATVPTAHHTLIGGTATVDSFDVGPTAPGQTRPFTFGIGTVRRGLASPVVGKDVSFTNTDGPPPAPTITSVTVH